MAFSFLKLIKKKGSETGAVSRDLPAIEEISMALLTRQKEDVPAEWEKIEAYPPGARALEAEPITGVIYQNRELILKIRTALGINHQLFEQMVMPVIRNFADFVHLLPASQSHHHRGSGGALRHALEVAFWSAQSAESVIFCLNGSQIERRAAEPMYRIATCLVGLLHDAGKPVSDLSIQDDFGGKWNPLEIGLYSWLRHDRRRTRYYLVWREGRHKRHEIWSQRMFNELVPTSIVARFNDIDIQIMERVSDALYSLDSRSHISRIVEKADHDSCRMDVERDHESQAHKDFNYGIPIHRYCFDAIRQLINTGAWKVNEPGAPVWVTDEGCFVAWKGEQNFSAVSDHIKSSIGVTVPANPDDLTDGMIMAGLAVPRYPDEDSESRDAENYYLYWHITPLMLVEGKPVDSVKLTAMKIDSPERLFREVPPKVSCKIWSEQDNKDGSNTLATIQESTPEQETPQESPTSITLDNGDRVNPQTGEIIPELVPKKDTDERINDLPNSAEVDAINLFGGKPTEAEAAGKFTTEKQQTTPVTPVKTDAIDDAFARATAALNAKPSNKKERNSKAKETCPKKNVETDKKVESGKQAPDISAEKATDNTDPIGCINAGLDEPRGPGAQRQGAAGRILVPLKTADLA